MKTESATIFVHWIYFFLLKDPSLQTNLCSLLLVLKYCVKFVRLILIFHFCVVYISFPFASLNLFELFKNRIYLGPGLGRLNNVARDITAHGQTQYNRVCYSVIKPVCLL